MMSKKPDKSGNDHPIEDIGVFEWLPTPGEKPSFVEDPATTIAHHRRLMAEGPQKPLQPVDYRLRWELPGMLLWLFLSATARDLIWQTALALALLAFAAWISPALQRRHIVSLALIYAGFGIGQLLLVAAQLFDLAPLRTATLVYGAALLLVWTLTELWYVFLSVDTPVNTDISY